MIVDRCRKFFLSLWDVIIYVKIDKDVNDFVFDVFPSLYYINERLSVWQFFMVPINRLNAKE